MVKDGDSSSAINPIQDLNGFSGTPFSKNNNLPQLPVDFNGVDGSFDMKSHITTEMPKISEALTNISQEPLLLESLTEPALIGALLTLGSLNAITGNSSLEISLQNVEPVHPNLPPPPIGLSSLEVNVDEQASLVVVPILLEDIQMLINNWLLYANHNFIENTSSQPHPNWIPPIFDFSRTPQAAALLSRMQVLDPQLVRNAATHFAQDFHGHALHSSTCLNSGDPEIQFYFDA